MLEEKIYISLGDGGIAEGDAPSGGLIEHWGRDCWPDSKRAVKEGGVKIYS